MPSNSRPNRGASSAACGLGDCRGTTCAPVVTQTVEQALSAKGYVVVRNTPYAGGLVTRHYGPPQASVNCLQIEINRHRYIDEQSMERSPERQALAQDIPDGRQGHGTLNTAHPTGKRQREGD